jgi:type IV secretory pathway VirB6-like protein
MRIALNIAGVILVFFGGVWFLQGINVLPGSFMTGEIKWAVYGGIAFVAGVALLLMANRRRKSQAPPA